MLRERFLPVSRYAQLFSAAILALTVLVLSLLLHPEGAAAQSRPADEELAARHAPVVMVSVLTGCYPDGGYDPRPVELILDQPANALYDDERQLVMRAPSAADVHGRPRRYFIDWPGDAKNPGCGYERRYRELTAGMPSVTYAHVATEEGERGVAVQYWFFYYYNDFLNLHEGDWEMIQVIYDEASTPEEAVGQQPTRLAYSGHAGGEQGKWTAAKVHREGDRPVVFVARGSHAAYFEPGTYLGVAKYGTVFGCDPVEAPFRRVEPDVVLLPDRDISRDEPFAWLEFDGMWGEERGDLFSGPTGPKERARWEEPISWANGLRDFSEKLPDEPIAGLDPLSPVCSIIGWGSQALIWYRLNPYLAGGAGLALLFASVAMLGYGLPDRLTRTGRRQLAEEARLKAASVRRPGFLVHPRTSGRIAWETLALYTSRPVLFVSIGAVFVPFAVLLGALQGLLGTSWLENRLNTSLVEPAFWLAISSAGALVATSIAGAATAWTIGEIDSGRRPGLLAAYRAVLSKFGSLAAANVLAGGAVSALAVTAIGLPLALNRLIAWAFVNHEVLLRRANAITALHLSGAHVSGNWWRSAGILAALALVIAVPGPVIAFAFLVFTEPPVTQSVHVVNMAVYAGLMLPLTSIAATLLYGDLVWRREAEERKKNA